MAWNPDTGADLTAATIRVADVEKTAMLLWAEFLGGWFDGGSHLLRGTAVTMPTLMTGGLTFQEQPLPKNIEGLCIQVLSARQHSAKRRLWSNEIWHISEPIRLDFYLRARVKDARADGHNSISLVRWASDNLFAILNSPLLTAALQRRGMTSFRPSPPTVVTDITATRMVSLNVIYTYSNEETTMTAPVIESDAPAGTVYVGADREIRVTPSGWEIKASDGNWYRVSVQFLQGDNGLVPTTDVQLVE